MLEKLKLKFEFDFLQVCIFNSLFNGTLLSKYKFRQSINELTILYYTG